ncbi:MAG: AsnC family transcriptional regulator, partial [Pseudomonadota bacterium]
MDAKEALDDLDRRILTVLATDGRISMTALGQRVGLSKTPVTTRVRRLEALGVITGYRAELSGRKLGLEHV